MVDSRTTSREWSHQFKFAYAIVAAYQALSCSDSRSLLTTGSTSLSVADMAFLVFIADGMNVPFTRTCRVGVFVISSRSFVRELPISSYQPHSRLRCLSDFLRGSSTHSSYSTVGSSTVFTVSGFETEYADLVTRTPKLTAPEIVPHSLASSRNLLLHWTSVSAVTIDPNFLA